MSRETIEQALDAGKLRVLTQRGTLWHVRRNGKTRTLKTRPGEFIIPIKYGFKSYGRIDHNNVDSSELVIVD